MKKRRNFLTSACGRVRKGLRRNAHEGGEELFDEFGEDVIVLAETRDLVSKQSEGD